VIWIVGAAETPRLHCGPLVLNQRAAGIGERDDPLLATGAGKRPVDDDAEDPGLERGAALKAIESAQNTEPGVLRHLFGQAGVSHIRACQTNHHRVIALDQQGEGRLVTCAKRGQEGGVVPHGAVATVVGRRDWQRS
jgi:hypothetical protein